MIIPGVASQVLATELAMLTDRQLVSIDRTQFPDGEHLVQLEEPIESDALIVASTVSDEAFIDLLLLQDAAREHGADHITTVIPYLGYGRQDSAFEAGQPISVRAMARAISTGTDSVVTVNPHEATILEFFDVPTAEVCSAAELANTLPTGLTEPVFIAPDAGARDLARTVRDAYGAGSIDHLEKTRVNDRNVEITPTGADVAGRDIVFVDDIIATGSTMVEAVRSIRDQQAADIIAACVHPVLADDAYIRLTKAGIDAIYGTDTIERPVSVISAATSLKPALHD